MRDERRRTLKIELLSQWKLEAEFRNLGTQASLTAVRSVPDGSDNHFDDMEEQTLKSSVSVGSASGHPWTERPARTSRSH